MVATKEELWAKSKSTRLRNLQARAAKEKLPKGEATVLKKLQAEVEGGRPVFLPQEGGRTPHGNP